MFFHNTDIANISNCHIIDLGYRILDLSCIVDISLKLNLGYLTKEDLIEKFMSKIIPTSYSTEKLLLNSNKTKQQIRSILIELQDLGVVSILSGRGGSVIADRGINFFKEQKGI